jgi:SAM-dependent methyltransferase
MIKKINYKGYEYPEFQTQGNASQFAIPFAKHVCIGEGYDIGCMKKEWAFPGAMPIDLSFDDEYHALNLPKMGVDYIFSSHCLEHIDGWVDVMDYWYDCLNDGGILFLYLPDYSQVYWRPWNNKKHRNMFSPQIIKDFLEDRGYNNIFVSGIDLNNAFMVMAEK